jgi:DNA repair exonuclease SbcCD ATPase subunit
MSHIDTKIEEHKQMLADLEKQKKDEEEAYRNTIDWNMEQLDKYVEINEMKIEDRRIQQIERNQKWPHKIEHSDYRVSDDNSHFRSKIYSENQIYTYTTPLKEPILLTRQSNGQDDIRTCHYHRYHIFEFVYRILKCLFTSTKQISNHCKEITSRLENLENENRNITEHLNLLENENKYLKEKLYDCLI